MFPSTGFHNGKSGQQTKNLSFIEIILNSGDLEIRVWERHSIGTAFHNKFW